MRFIEIAVLSVWIIGGLGFTVSSLFAAPSKIITEPTSPFVVVDKPIDHRPVQAMISLGESLLIGTDENIYLSNPLTGEYCLQLPHSIWENEAPFIAGDYVYCTVNRYHRNANRGLKQLYRAHKDSLQDNRLNWKRISPEFTMVSDMLAIDDKKHIIYTANRFDNRHTSLYKRSIDNFSTTQIVDERLKNITALGIFQGSLYVVANNRLFISKDQGDTFKDISSSLGNGHIGKAKILTNDHYLILNIGQHYTYVFDGKDWKEITAKTVKYGSLSFYGIEALQGHQLVLSQMGMGKIHVVDLERGEWQPITLPKLYHYRAFAIYKNALYVSSILPNDPAIRAIQGKKIPNPRVERNQFIFRVPLKEIPIIQAFWGNQRPEVIAESEKMLGYGKIIDSGRIYRNNGKRIVDAQNNETITKPLKHPFGFKQGKIKGHWFIYNEGRLMCSENKGKAWKIMDLPVIIPHHAIIDDSLHIAYTHNRSVLSRYNLITGEVDYNDSDDFKGHIEQLHLDKTGRLFVQTSKGVYISHDRGFWGCPSSMRDEKHIPIKGFAYSGNRMAVTYKNRLYLSRTDVIDWEELQLCMPEDDDLHLQIQIVGFDEKHIVLQELGYGHIWVINPDTREKQRVIFPRDNGVIRTADISGNKLVVETTGVPFYPLKKSLKHHQPAHLLNYTLNLKNDTLWTD